MGQTLTHGIYLPDEGERNCYSGLAANWQILDSAIGTVAEHTTQIAGKAPLVHTHSKADITDFPAYGNAAGTICEGNDSRLSDARTPVAHTHTKSDVTDLFNSTNTWSANNEYKYLIGLSGAEIWFKQPNIEDITANPDANISKSIIQIYNKTVTQYSGGIADILRTDGSHRLVISCFGFPLNNYAGYYPHTFYFEAKRDGTASFSPSYTNANLGTSTNKWKSFNGINPGALSFPKVDGWNSGQDLDAVGIDTTNWDMTSGTWNELTNNIHDGWVYFAFKNCSAGDRISVRYHGTDARYITLGFAHLSAGYMYCAFPLAKGFKANIAFTTSGIVMSKFIYPCIGNV